MHDTQGEVTRKPGFQKGHAKVGGRKKGGQNKITRDVKEAVFTAGQKHGSDGKGKDELCWRISSCDQEEAENSVLHRC